MSLNFHPVQSSANAISQPSPPFSAFPLKNFPWLWCNYFITVAHNMWKALKSDLRFFSLEKFWTYFQLPLCMKLVVQTLLQLLCSSLDTSTSMTFCNAELKTESRIWDASAALVPWTWHMKALRMTDMRCYRHKVLCCADLTADLPVFFTGRIKRTILRRENLWLMYYD